MVLTLHKLGHFCAFFLSTNPCTNNQYLLGLGSRFNFLNKEITKIEKPIVQLSLKVLPYKKDNILLNNSLTLDGPLFGDRYYCM
jgi:hypothetical protein